MRPTWLSPRFGLGESEINERLPLESRSFRQTQKTVYAPIYPSPKHRSTVTKRRMSLPPGLLLEDPVFVALGVVSREVGDEGGGLYRGVSATVIAGVKPHSEGVSSEPARSMTSSACGHRARTRAGRRLYGEDGAAIAASLPSASHDRSVTRRKQELRQTHPRLGPYLRRTARRATSQGDAGTAGSGRATAPPGRPRFGRWWPVPSALPGRP